MTAAGYVGFVAGPPLVGWVADVTSLQWGLLVLALAAFIGASLPLRAQDG